MQPHLSVIIPTLNRSETLGRAVRSVLDQTVNDFELIVVNEAALALPTPQTAGSGWWSARSPATLPRRGIRDRGGNSMG
jgi:hypothetical protein